MAYENGYRLWDDEYEQAHWTPEELATSNARVARTNKIIDAEHNGEISHDEAMIRHLMLDPDLLEVMLDDACGDTEQVKRIHSWYNEAKARAREARYWDSLLGHAQITAQSGYNREAVIHTLNEALEILKDAVPEGA